MSWPISTFGEVATVVTGSTPKKIDGNYGGSIPFVTPGDLGSVVEVRDSKVKLTEAGANSGRLLPVNSVLVCCIGATIGKTGFAVTPVVTNQQINSLVFDEEKVFPKFAYHYCSTLKSFLMNRSSSTTMPIVNKTSFSEIEIPLPPLAEQKRIAAILDKADAIRRKRQQAIQLADDFLRAVFLDMFGDPVTNPKGWDVDRFGNVFDVRDGTHDSPTYVESGFPLITSKNIKNGEIDMSDTNYISKVDYELINRRSKVDVGDILMPMIGTIGNPAVVHDEPNFAIKNVALIKLRNSGLPAGFVLALLNSSLLDVAVQQKSRGGTQKFLGLSDIRNLNCYLPDERLVSKYICIANKVRQFASAYRKSNEAGLYSSLSQKAFRGEL